MLDALRRSSSGWIAKILMGLLVVSFAVWGVNDVFTGYSTDAVASVGDEPISANDFQRAVDGKIREFSERLGQPLTRAQAHQYGLDAAALSELIGLTALDTGAENAGLTVSDNTVATNITSDPAFRSPFGKFDRQGFDRALQQMSVTEKAFIADRRKYLVRLQMNNALEAGIHVPTIMTDAISIYQGETRTAKYVILPPDLVGKIADPDEATLDAYYKKAAIHFTTPETRSFTLMELNPQDLAKTVLVSDEDLKAAYEKRRAEFDVPERRAVEQLPFATEEAAKAADEKLKSGTPLKEIVAELGLTMSDVDLGNVTRREMLSPALAEAAFTLKPGNYSAPVQGPLGPVILHVSSVTPAQPSTFDGVKDDLRQKMTREMAQDQVYDVQNDIEDSRAGGATMEEIAAKNHLNILKFSDLTAKGTDLDDKKPDALPDYKELMKTVFDNLEGDLIPPGDTGEGGYYWVRVDKVTPAAQKPLDTVRKDVVNLWKEETRKAKLKEFAQGLADRGNKGESLEKIAASINRAALTSPNLQRSSQSDTFSRLSVTRLFALPKGGFTSGPVGYGDSLILMEAMGIDQPTPDPTSKAYQTIQTSLDGAIKGDLLVAMIAGFEKKLGTKVNTKLIDRMMSDNGQ